MLSLINVPFIFVQVPSFTFFIYFYGPETRICPWIHSKNRRDLCGQKNCVVRWNQQLEGELGTGMRDTDSKVHVCSLRESGWILYGGWIWVRVPLGAWNGKGCIFSWSFYFISLFLWIIYKCFLIISLCLAPNWYPSGNPVQNSPYFSVGLPKGHQPVIPNSTAFWIQLWTWPCGCKDCLVNIRQ